MMATISTEISAVKVEERIEAHPSFSDAIVVGIANQRRGHWVWTLVTVGNGYNGDEQALINPIRTQIDGYKRSKPFSTLDALLRQPTSNPVCTSAHNFFAQR